MSKRFRPSNRGEAKLISKIESSKEYERRRAINVAGERLDSLSNSIAMKLVENNLVETGNKNSLQEQISHCLEQLIHADDFHIDYQVAPFRHVVSNPNVVSLYVTAFVIEQLIKHKDVIDIYGSDEEIYACIHRQVSRQLA
jgi:hypothetical protein